MMRLVSKEKLLALQKNPSSVRNVCIMAHVDHGKTTLADSLVANNGIISPRMAGKLRYMDSRKDEQERGITMKSSSISLFHIVGESKEFLINLIDSPGHVDFSSEVSTAVRLCDGAVVVVDVVEGVCPQTKVSLQQAWEENIKMVLVLNKMDRLIVEMKLTSLDAYVHLIQVLEQVNAVMGELFATSVLGRCKASNESVAKGLNDVYDWSTGLEDEDDSHLYFSPDQGNVIFASAVDGWGFDVKDFAKLFATKLHIDENLLKKTLWGDYYLHSKSKKILKGAQSKAKKPLFVQLILESIWSVYDTIVTCKQKDRIPKIADSLGIQMTARDLRHSDCKVQLQAVLSQWLPLANAVLDMVCIKLPSPLEIGDEKVNKLFSLPNYIFEKLPEETKFLKSAFKKCSSEAAAPVIIFISKMFPVERKHLPVNRQNPLTAEEILQRREEARRKHAEKVLYQASEGMEEPSLPLASVDIPQLVTKETLGTRKQMADATENDDTLIAFARVFSGTVRKGQRLYVLGPKHDPCKALNKFKNGNEVDPSITLKDLKFGEHITVATIDDLYLLMGRELEVLEVASAGNIIGIGGLEEHVLKSATLSSSLGCPAFAEAISSGAGDIPIFRVAVEPCHPSEMPALVKGLRLLNQADAAVQVVLQESGEHVLATAGEVHLQRCLQDLKERYAKIEINVSEPIVPFRETIVVPPKVDMVNEVIQEHNISVKTREDGIDDNGLVTITTPNKRSVLKIKAVPLPEDVTEILHNSCDVIRDMEKVLNQQLRVEGDFVTEKIASLSLRNDPIPAECECYNSPSQEMIEEIKNLKSKLKKAFAGAGRSWENAEECIWNFGPRRCGPNILLNKIHNATHLNFWGSKDSTSKGSDDRSDQLSNYSSSFINGFQLATLAGPLCEEPMMGVCFVVEDWTILEATEEASQENAATNMPYGPFSGQIMSAVKEACRKAFHAQPQRLMAAMYSCSILVNAEVLAIKWLMKPDEHFICKSAVVSKVLPIERLFGQLISTA